MVAWLSWLFEAKPGADQTALCAHDELRELRIRRRQVINNIGSLKAYGFVSLAQDDEAELKFIDRKILALQVKCGEPVDAA
jgi:hypothetical protein